MSPAPLRIVHIVRAPIGGIFRHISDLALAQTRDGHHVGVVCDASSGGAFEDRAIADLAPRLAFGVRRYAMRRAVTPGDILASCGIYRQIRNLRPDILHGHGAKGGFFARAVGTMFRLRGHKATRIYCPHGGSLHFDPARLDGRIYFLFERLQQAMTDGIVFVSDYELAAYEAKVATPKVPARVVYNGLAPHEFAPVEVEGDAADFLFIGMLRDLKGPDLFIRALHDLKLAHGLTPTATIAGEGEERAKYERMVADFGLEGRVRFVGSLPAREAFRKARCVVVPSRAEAMPYIVLEAVAAEKPLIATRVGGVPEIYGRFADRLVEPGDPAALTGAMAAAYAEPEKMRGFAVALRKGLADSFNIDLMNDRITSLYLGVRNGSSGEVQSAGVGRVAHLTPSEMLARTGETPSSRRFD